MEKVRRRLRLAIMLVILCIGLSIQATILGLFQPTF